MFDFLSKKFSGILGWLSNKGTLSEKNIKDALSQVKEALLEADVPYDVVETFLSQISEEALGQKVDKKVTAGNKFIKIVHDKLVSFLGGETQDKQLSIQYPSVILMMGLQGSGKTTTIAKMANWLKKEAAKKNKTRRILLASVDFYRPAAVDQLEILSKQVSVDFYRSEETDVCQAAKDILNKFKKDSYEVLFLDTAGRLQIDTDLMEELKKVSEIVKPKHSFIVLDSMTGQESLNIAQEFNKSVGFSSAILSKMDSDSRSGAAFAFRYSIKKPIYFIGTGEKIDDLEPFIPKRIATRILGMGDIVSLIEKAEENISHEKQEEMAKKMVSGRFNLDDFAKQINMMGKIGSFRKILQYMPGAGSISPEMIEQSEKDMKKFKAILSSMTKKERLFPNILNSSRKERIASGSGTNLQNINQLLQKFEQSKQFAKMFKKMGKMPFFK